MFPVLKLFPKIFFLDKQKKTQGGRQHGVFKVTSSGKGISETLGLGHCLQSSVMFSGLFSVYFLFLSKTVSVVRPCDSAQRANPRGLSANHNYYKKELSSQKCEGRPEPPLRVPGGA